MNNVIILFKSHSFLFKAVSLLTNLKQHVRLWPIGFVLLYIYYINEVVLNRETLVISSYCVYTRFFKESMFNFGLTISRVKTEVLHHPAPGTDFNPLELSVMARFSLPQTLLST